MNIKYLEKIEFSKICEILTSYCKTYIGKGFATNIEPLSTEKDIQKALDQTSEAVILLYRKGSVPISEIADITVSLKRLETLSSLSAKQLLDLGEILQISHELKNYFFNSDFDLSEFKNLTNLFYNLYTNESLEKTIFSSIIDEYTISDTASVKLATIRRNKREKEQEIKNKLNSLLRTKYVQEPVVTMRAGRFVIPVKNEYRSEVKGFVHDISSSGSTVFIEPLSVFDLNNDINKLNLEENLEIEQILEKLSSMFYDLINELQNNANLIGLLDFIFAKAKYSKDIDGSAAKINHEKKIILLQAWHPLINKDIAIKNDISLGHFAAGSGKSLIVQLSLSEDMDNTYEKMLGKVKWVFTAAGGAFGPEKENESSGASDTVEDDTAQNNRNNGYTGTSDEKHEGNERNQGVGAEEKIYASVAASPKTGDPTQAAVKWFILFAALTVMVLTFRKLYGKGKNR